MLNWNQCTGDRARDWFGARARKLQLLWRISRVVAPRLQNEGRQLGPHGVSLNSRYRRFGRRCHSATFDCGGPDDPLTHADIPKMGVNLPRRFTSSSADRPVGAAVGKADELQSRPLKLEVLHRDSAKKQRPPGHDGAPAGNENHVALRRPRRFAHMQASETNFDPRPVRPAAGDHGDAQSRESRSSPNSFGR